MRVLLVLIAVLGLVSCGGDSTPEPQIGRAIGGAGAPRFADTDPHDWVGSTLPWHYPVHGIDVSK